MKLSKKSINKVTHNIIIKSEGDRRQERKKGNEYKTNLVTVH